MPEDKILKIRLSLKGRPVKAFTFEQPTITVGRDPKADVFLDNPGISREHLRISRTSGGYFEVEDLGSANGTYVNDQLVRREYLMNNDVVRVGKFSLWVNYDVDRREARMSSPTATAKTYEGTTVLSTRELDQMIHSTTEEAPALSVVEGGLAPRADAAAQTDVETAKVPGSNLLLTAALAAFVLGVAAGGAAVWWLMR